MTGHLKAYLAWKIVLAIAGLIGLYHLIAHILQKPLFGVSNMLNALGHRLFARALRKAELSERFSTEEDAEFAGGRMKRKVRGPTPDPTQLV